MSELTYSGTWYLVFHVQLRASVEMADWRTSTLNSNLSTTQRLLNRNFAPQVHTPTGRPIPSKPSPLLAEDRGESPRLGLLVLQLSLLLSHCSECVQI